MKTTERLMNAAKDIWQAYNEHPFVLGIQNGTLDKEKFRFYIIQDYLYLEEYAKVFAVGVAKAKSLETAKLFSKYIAVMNGELDVHSGYLAKFLIPPTCFVWRMKKAKQKSSPRFSPVHTVMRSSPKRWCSSTQPALKTRFTAHGFKGIPPTLTVKETSCFWTR